MRIALVSAHYPPNFVSGGTLVPQRLARGLRRRGHEVSVFAGRLDPDAEPLSEFDDVDAVDDAIAVHWIDVTPWTGWDDPRNVDNPPITNAFGAWLERVRPDVVHAHSLQAIGAGVIDAAADRDVPVVVTMHDFWWFCARQFLVDTDYHPCSLVVDAGTCACQRGAAARSARLETLAPRLARIDRVLAPSRITRDVLVANGVDPERIHVDENGLDLDPSLYRSTGRATDRATVDTAAPIRLRYTGGPDPMKGVAVLATAAEAAADVDGWTLTAHLPGDEPIAARLAAMDPVTVEAPYPPDALDAVMAATDVLVLPSVMRETHSIVTREAMIRGVPVIATDSLGPEEVIVDGTNGLIVPSDDPDALAAAIRRVATDRELVHRMAAVTTEVAIRSVDEQVDGVARHLAEVVDERRRTRSRATTGAATATGRLGRWQRIVYAVGIDGAPLRYRAQFPAEALAALGADVSVLHYNDPGLADAMRSADAVVAYRVPATDRIIDLLDETRAKGVPVVFDVDDLIVDPTVESDIPALRLQSEEENALWRRGIHRYRTTLEHCDAYSGSTAPLVAHIGALTGMPSFVKANHYGTHLARHSDAARRRARTPGPVRIGYFSGTTTHDEDLHHVVPALVHTLEAVPDAEVWLGGLLPDVEALARFGTRVRRLPFVPWHELPGVLRQVDVNLAPLADHGVFNEAKSAIKWLEAAMVETPTIASPTAPFIEAIKDGRNGRLARSVDEWSDALVALVTDDDARRSMGARAHRSALLDWGPAHAGRRVLEIFDAVADGGRRSAPATPWNDVTDPEPAAAVAIPLSPYPPADTAGAVEPVTTPEGRRAWLRRAMGALWHEPPSATVPAISRRLRRELGRARGLFRRG